MGSGILIALAAGLLIAGQVSIMGRYASSVGTLAVALLVQLSGLIGAAVWMLATHRWEQVFASARGWWWIAAGLAGWLVLTTIATAASRLGVATTLAIVVAAQLTAALTWDAWTGTAPVNLRAIAGLVILVGGVYLLANR